MKILIVAPAWLGDMVMAHSLIQALCAQRQGLEISVLAPAASLPITHLMPEVSQRFLMPEGHGDFHFLTRWKLAKKLKAEHFDEAYVLPNTWKSALVPFLARIPKRIGAKGEQRYGLLNCMHSRIKSLPLMVERYVALASPPNVFHSGMSFPYPNLVVPDTLRMQVAKRFSLFFPSKKFSDLAELEGLPGEPSLMPAPSLVDLDLLMASSEAKRGLSEQAVNLSQAGNQHRKVIAFCPGAAFGPAKRWPASYFAVLAQALCEKNNEVWLLGGPSERDLGLEITQAEPRVRNFIGETSLLEMAALLSLADQVLTNDSGPMHIAASLKRPVFAIFGSSSPRFTPPLGDQVTVIEIDGLACRPCFQKTCLFQHYACLRDIQPKTILALLEGSE